MEHEEGNEKVQASAGKSLERELPMKSPIMRMEPCIIKELLRVMPDGVIMEIYFDD